MRFSNLKLNKIEKLPKTAGVYCFKDEKKILYIGKATNIKERVKNHFSQPAYRDNLFINQVSKIGYIKTNSEFAEPSAHLPKRSEGREMNGVQRTTSHPASQGSTIEALILEANLIKKYQPKYNVVWRDDKNYFYVGATKEDFPRVFITHQPKLQTTNYKLQTKYVGPFVEGAALKQTLKILRKVFPYRSCYKIPNRPCLWYHLNRCPAPCLLKISACRGRPPANSRRGRPPVNFWGRMKQECQKNAKNLMKILKEGKNPVLKDLKREMKFASKKQGFEEAAKIRDQIAALEKVLANAKIFDTVDVDVSDVDVRRQHGNDRDKLRGVLQKILKTKNEISRIEAYDISNIQGQEATGSMVTFINGLPDKNFYRRFKIKIAGKPNDIAMIKEVLKRRFGHPEWGLPDLILIDGGKAQLNAAILTAKSCKLKAKIMALAKKENKLFIESQKQPILLKNLPRGIFNLILQLRDEAHRFAISYHWKLREKFLLEK